jgi:hypothetical protein
MKLDTQNSRVKIYEHKDAKVNQSTTRKGADPAE